MILRNGLHSMTRSGKRTALFLTLIFFLSLILSVSGGIWLYSAGLIKECGTAYRCAATVEYTGRVDPSGEKENADATRAAGLISDTDILAVDGVRYFMRRDISLGSVENYTRTAGFAREDRAVLKVGSFIKESDDHWIVTVREVVYSFSCDTDILINLVTEGTGFIPEKDTPYYVNGYFSKTGPQNGFRNFHLEPFENSGALPWAKDGEDIEAFREAAGEYASVNNAVIIERSEDTEALPAFQQGDIRLTEGSFPAGDHECVVSEDVAGILGLSAGSTFRMKQLTPLGGSLYNTEGSGDYEEYTVSGIASAASDWRSYIWTTPGSIRSPLYGRLIGTIVFDNEKAGSAYEELTDLMPDGVIMTLYDQGYEAAVSPLREAVSASSFICLIAAGTMFFVLIFFMYIFTGMQEENIRTMVCLGTPDSDITKWLMAGAAPIVVIASSLGAAAGCFLLPLAVRAAKMLSGLRDPFPSYYSEVSQGLQKELPDFGSIDPRPILCMMLVFAVTSMLILYVFANRLRKTALLERGQTKVRIPKGTTSTALSGAIRFARLSALRGGLRSAVVVLLSFVMCLSVAMTSAYTSEWQSRLSDASTRITTKGALVSSSGDILEDAAAQASAIRHLNSMPEVTDLRVSVRWNYWFPDDMPAFARTGFGEEHRQEWISEQPYLYALNSMDATQETCYAPPLISWTDGYDESILTEDFSCMFSFEMGFEDAPGTYPAVITRTLAERKGIRPGDIFSVELSHRYINQHYTYHSSSGSTGETTLRLRAAGILENDRGSESLFIPLSAYGNYTGNDPSVTSMPGSILNEKQLRDYLYLSSAYSYCSFTIRDGVSPDEFKDRLIGEGFSAPGHMRRERTAVMLFDREYVLLRDGARKFIRTGLRMTGVILALIALTGYILSYLSANARRNEIKLMMTLGCRTGRIRASFLLEQLMLILPGLICLPAVLLLNENAGIFTVLSTVLYVLIYTAGSAVSIRTVMKSALISRTEE